MMSLEFVPILKKNESGGPEPNAHNRLKRNIQEISPANEDLMRHLAKIACCAATQKK
jgi:hypothetical protein